MEFLCILLGGPELTIRIHLVLWKIKKWVYRIQDYHLNKVQFPFDPKSPSPNHEPLWPWRLSFLYPTLFLFCVWMLHTLPSFWNWSPEEGPTPQQDLSLSVGLPWAKEKIKTNRTLISMSRFSLLSCRQKEPSPGRQPQIKASCSPLAASPIRITTTKPAETIIYSFWCGFWSYPTSSTMLPPTPTPLSFLLPSSSSPSPSSSWYLLLPRKQGHASFSVKKEAPLKEKEFHNQRLFLILHQGKCVVAWEKVDGLLHSSDRHPIECVCQVVNITFTV